MNEELVKRGYLHQRVSVRSCFRTRQVWHRVFLTLKDGCLFFYESPRDLQPLEVYPLYASCVLFPQYPKVVRSNCLQIETPTNSLYLCADSPADISSWAVYIQKAAILASGGSIGKLHVQSSPQPTSSIALNASSGASTAFATPNAKYRSLHASHMSTPGPLDFTDTGQLLARATSIVDLQHSSEASALIAESVAAASYDRVLQRFRSCSSVTTFTSTSLANVAESYIKHRSQGKRRIAQEWLAESRRHNAENNQRQSLPSTVQPLNYDIEALGSCKPASTTVELHNGTGTLSVTNQCPHPIAVRLGDRTTSTWLKTNTPFFLQPRESRNIEIHCDGSTSTTSSSSSAASSSPSLSTPPSFPQLVPLRSKPCDSSDIEVTSSSLLLFENEEGEPTHRIGEREFIQLQ
jgi:hypothetical protein